MNKLQLYTFTCKNLLQNETDIYSIDTHHNNILHRQHAVLFIQINKNINKLGKTFSCWFTDLIVKHWSVGQKHTIQDHFHLDWKVILTWLGSL